MVLCATKQESETMTQQIDMRIRPFQEGDYPFCRDSFYKGAASSHDFTGMDQNIVKPGLRARFDKMRQFSDINIACDVEHDEPLFGWVAYTALPTHTIIWWVYVKSGYRNFNFCRKLIEDVAPDGVRIVYPWKSRASQSLALSFDAQYNPFLFEELLANED
jgi:hypothetical protein